MPANSGIRKIARTHGVLLQALSSFKNVPMLRQ